MVKEANIKYPEDKVVKTWKKDNLVLSIVKHPSMGHYCGYVRFTKRPVRELGYNGILTYVPVHGGITYANEDKDKTMVYGFDCSHYSDWGIYYQDGKKWSIEEVIEETERMAIAINLIKKYEKRYLRNITNKGKAKVVDEYHKELSDNYKINFDLQDNFGSMLNLLVGSI